jgi:hypothetical protein
MVTLTTYWVTIAAAASNGVVVSVDAVTPGGDAVSDDVGFGLLLLDCCVAVQPDVERVSANASAAAITITASHAITKTLSLRAGNRPTSSAVARERSRL